MRELSVIRVDIQRAEKNLKTLNAEFDEVNKHEAKRNSAVSVLENLGWRHNGNKWVSPPQSKPMNHKVYKAAVVPGVFATWDNQLLGGHVCVNDVDFVKGMANVSRIKSVTMCSANIGRETFNVPFEELTVKPRTWFIGK